MFRRRSRARFFATISSLLLGPWACGGGCDWVPGSREGPGLQALEDEHVRGSLENAVKCWQRRNPDVHKTVLMGLGRLKGHQTLVVRTGGRESTLSPGQELLEARQAHSDPSIGLLHAMRPSSRRRAAERRLPPTVAHPPCCSKLVSDGHAVEARLFGSEHGEPGKGFGEALQNKAPNGLSIGARRRRQSRGAGSRRGGRRGRGSRRHRRGKQDVDFMH
mmetsp:Transcript_24601/g.72128  ORF Transcript_24601/g.72128 Transcript_24601/m.72128 type:complete len:219 (-) Transcript_24601:373-1029(-)